MKRYVAVGVAITSEFVSMSQLVVGAKSHHEPYDGIGYSSGLAGEDMPIKGRIIGLADAIDAMFGDRIYRKKRSREFLLQELEKGSGKQFDPKLVEIAIGLIQGGMIENISGQVTETARY